MITRISIISAADSQENKTIIISYDSNNRVSSISDGVEAGVLVYNNGSLTNISGSDDTFNIEQLYNSPYDAFETVEEYDNNGNPINITFYEQEYNNVTGLYENVNYKAEVLYDTNPNLYFYTLQAAGIIDIMDKVDLNFSLNPQIPQIVKARMLFPLNNIKRIVYKDNNSVVVYELLIDIVYNEFNYPTSATMLGTSFLDNSNSVYTVSYSYK